MITSQLRSSGKARGDVGAGPLYEFVNSLVKSQHKLETLMSCSQGNDRRVNKFSYTGHFALFTGSLRKQFSAGCDKSCEITEGMIGEGAVAATRRRVGADATAREQKYERRAQVISPR